MLRGVTLRAAEIEGTAVFRIVVSSDSIKKATATSHGNRRLLVGESDGVMAASGALIKKLWIGPSAAEAASVACVYRWLEEFACVPSSVPQGRVNLTQDESPGSGRGKDV
jgi:hypothetical protein